MKKRLDDVIEAARRTERAEIIAWLATEKAKEEYYEGGLSGLAAAIEKGWHVPARPKTEQRNREPRAR